MKISKKLRNEILNAVADGIMDGVLEYMPDYSDRPPDKCSELDNQTLNLLFLTENRICNKITRLLTNMEK